MTRKAKRHLPEMSGWTDEQIAEFWESHDSADYGDELKEVQDVTFAKSPMSLISLQLEVGDLDQIKALAGHKQLSYKTLLRMWIKERLIETRQLAQKKAYLRRLIAQLPGAPKVREIRAEIEPESEIISFWIQLARGGEPLRWRVHPSQLEGALALPRLEQELLDDLAALLQVGGAKDMQVKAGTLS